MAGKIKTTGTTNDPVETEHQSGQNTRQWVGDHSGSVAASTPSGNSLTTSWDCVEEGGDGNDASDGKTTTLRQDGEADAEFLARHIYEYVLDMLVCLPVA